MRFHTQLADAEAARPASLEMTHMIAGVRQPTGTTVRITGAGYAELGEAFGGENDYGDATVPLAGALGHRLSGDSNRVCTASPTITATSPATEPRWTKSKAF